MPVAAKPEKKKCAPCGYDSIKLEDEKPVVPEVIPIEPTLPGATLDDIDALKNELRDFKNTLIALSDKVEKHFTDTDANFKTIEQNMQFLDARLKEHSKKIDKNTSDIAGLRRELELLKQQMADQLAKVGSKIDGLGGTDLSGALGALEEQIKNAGGLNIGDRWRLRFQDNENKDIFLQDRNLKGYYRFRTTKCDRVVPGAKCNPCCRDEGECNSDE